MMMFVTTMMSSVSITVSAFILVFMSMLSFLFSMENILTFKYHIDIAKNKYDKLYNLQKIYQTTSEIHHYHFKIMVHFLIENGFRSQNNISNHV